MQENQTELVGLFKYVIHLTCWVIVTRWSYNLPRSDMIVPHVDKWNIDAMNENPCLL